MKAIDLIITNSNFICDVINVGTGIATSIREAASIFLNQLSGSDYQPTFNKIIKQGDPNYLVADISKLKSLGFKNDISLQEGLKKYADWVKNYQNNF